MSFLDSLKNFLKNLSSGESKSGSTASSGNKAKVALSCDALPTNVEDLKALPFADFKNPNAVAAMTVLALCAYPKSKDACCDMLNYLKGPQPLTPYEKQFLEDRFMESDYVPRSYLKGARPENDYTPSVPYTVVVEEGAHSRDQLSEGYLTLFLTSGGADNPRFVRLRKKGSTGEWFLWEQFLMPGIVKPVSQNPWA